MDKTKEQIIATRDDVGMIKNPSLWPNWPILPMKRYQPSGNWPQLGVITDGIGPDTMDREKTIVFLTDLGALGLTAEQLEYDSPEACVADGWVVD